MMQRQLTFRMKAYIHFGLRASMVRQISMLDSVSDTGKAPVSLMLTTHSLPSICALTHRCAIICCTAHNVA